MKRFLRIIFTGVTLLSLLLGVGTCGLWTWSKLSPGVYHGIIGGDGDTETEIKPVHIGFSYGSFVYEGPPQVMQTLTFSLGGPVVTHPMGPKLVLIKCWKIAAVFSALPLLWILIFRKQRMAKPGHCRNCGYDLRASPNRCPECGTAIASEISV